MIVCLNPNYKYTVKFDAKPVVNKTLYTDLIQITLPATNKTGELLVKR